MSNPKILRSAFVSLTLIGGSFCLFTSQIVVGIVTLSLGLFSGFLLLTSKGKLNFRKKDLKSRGSEIWLKLNFFIFQRIHDKTLHLKVPQMTDSNLLNMIALRHKSEVTRMDAINNPQLTDSETLKSALSDPNESVRLTAARKLDDDLIWTQLVMDDPHYMVRYFAVEKSTDEATLVKIALHDEDDYIREAALNNPHLKDQSVLERLAQNDHDESIRKLAQSKIERLRL